jgi:signal transduction histidine kinase
VRASDTARQRFQVDWLISNLRWLLLASVGLVLLADAAIQGGGTIRVNAILPQVVVWVLAVLYNLTVTLLLLYGVPGRPLPVVTLAVDTVLTISFVVTSGGLDSPLLFFALFPILTAALRYPWFVSALIGLAVVGSCGLVGYYLLPTGGSPSRLLPFAGRALVLVLATLVSGLVGDRVKLRIARTKQLEDEAELRRLRTTHERSRLISQLAATLSATLNYNAVLEAMIEVGEAGMRELDQHPSTHISLVLLFNQNRLHIVTSRHLPQRDQRVTFSGRAGALAHALTAAEPVIVEKPAEDPELGQLIVLHGCRHAVVVPLRAGFQNYGAVVFASTRAKTYTDDHVDLLVALCNQAIVALQNAQLYQSLMAEKEHIVAVEEDARKKLARDLHDGPTQSIAAIAMRINYIRTLQDRAPERVSEELAQVEEMARRTTKEIRQMLFTLRPLVLETQGLRAALEQYVAKLRETERATVVLEASPGVDQPLDSSTQGVLFYIIEEAIGNARKHARADTIWVRLSAPPGGGFVAEVEDDGVGFDVADVQAGYDERGSLGMVNMRERAELIGAQLTIASRPGHGTRVRIVVPART